MYAAGDGVPCGNFFSESILFSYGKTCLQGFSFSWDFQAAQKFSFAKNVYYPVAW